MTQIKQPQVGNVITGFRQLFKFRLDALKTLVQYEQFQREDNAKRKPSHKFRMWLLHIELPKNAEFGQFDAGAHIGKCYIYWARGRPSVLEVEDVAQSDEWVALKVQLRMQHSSLFWDK